MNEETKNIGKTTAIRLIVFILFVGIVGGYTIFVNPLGVDSEQGIAISGVEI